MIGPPDQWVVIALDDGRKLGTSFTWEPVEGELAEQARPVHEAMLHMTDWPYSDPPKVGQRLKGHAKIGDQAWDLELEIKRLSDGNIHLGGTGTLRDIALSSK